MELHECAANDLGISVEEVAKRWEEPFNIVSDIFQVKDLYGNLIPYKPYPYSVEFLNKGFYQIDVDRCVLKSRQIGFSTIAEIEAVITGATFEDQEVAFVSNQYKNSKKLIEACGTIIKNSKYPLPYSKRNIQKQKIKSDTGMTLIPYSSNPDSIRGDSAVRVYLDEFSSVKDQDATMDAVEPKLSRGGQVTMMSTPLRNDDLFMKTFSSMRSGALAGNVFYCPLFDESEVDINVSLTAQTLNPICPDIDLRRVETVRLKSINRFLQEYMCQPVDELNAYYPYDLILECTKREPIYSNGTGDVTIMGLDHALVHDETSFVINRISDNGINNIVYIETTQDEYHDQLRRCAELYVKYGVNQIRADATGEMGIQVERDLRKRFGHTVTGVKYTNTIKGEMAMRLKYLMQNTKNGMLPSIKLPDNSEMIAQLHNMKVEVSQSGNTKYSGKNGGGLDDIVNALWLSIPPDIIERVTHANVSRSDIAPNKREYKVTPRKGRKPISNYSTVTKGKRHLKTRGKRGQL